jgi:hypothetical protein
MTVRVFGVAFVIAFITQAQNGASNRWHKDLTVSSSSAESATATKRNNIEEYIVYTLGHCEFLARAGVAVFMFKSLRHSDIKPEKDAFSDAINQVIRMHGGSIGL